MKAVLTDINGAFNATVSGQGDFLLTVSSMGRKPVVCDFSVGASDKEVDLGTLHIADAANELNEVVVTAQKPLVKPTTPTRRPTPCWRCSARCRWSPWTARTTSR